MTYIIDEQCTAVDPRLPFYEFKIDGETHRTNCKNCATMLDDSARELPREHVAHWDD